VKCAWEARCIGWLPGLIRVIAAIEQNFPIVV